MIATGSRSTPGPELLATSGMVELLMQLRTRFGVIIVDSPPMGACTDPLALATLTRDTLLVVRTDQTRTATLEMNLEMLDRLPVRVLGAVVNDVSEEGGIYRAYGYVDGYEYAAVPGESDAPLLTSG
jgi:Mrp family chromosome partitioning ATPase